MSKAFVSSDYLESQSFFILIPAKGRTLAGPPKKFNRFAGAKRFFIECNGPPYSRLAVVLLYPFCPFHHLILYENNPIYNRKEHDFSIMLPLFPPAHGPSAFSIQFLHRLADDQFILQVHSAVVDDSVLQAA